MTDGIIKGTGNSRYLKGPANAPALWSTHDAFMQAFAAGEVLIDLNGINPLGWDTIGDKLGKETLLKDETAQAAGLTTDAVPDDVLAWLIGQAKGIRSIATGGTGNATGNAASATKLQTARTIQTNLASTGEASFNGTSNITPGVTGVLPVANGGTGATSLSTLANAIVPYISGVTKIETGWYSGTGKYGSTNPCSITCSFVPKFIYIASGKDPRIPIKYGYSNYTQAFMLIHVEARIGYAVLYAINNAGKLDNPTNTYTSVENKWIISCNPVSVSENIVSWFGTNTYSQLNQTTSTSQGESYNHGVYHWVAIG